MCVHRGDHRTGNCRMCHPIPGPQEQRILGGPSERWPIGAGVEMPQLWEGDDS